MTNAIGDWTTRPAMGTNSPWNNEPELDFSSEVLVLCGEDYNTININGVDYYYTSQLDEMTDVMQSISQLIPDCKQDINKVIDIFNSYALSLDELFNYVVKEHFDLDVFEIDEVKEAFVDELIEVTGLTRTELINDVVFI